MQLDKALQSLLAANGEQNSWLLCKEPLCPGGFNRAAVLFRKRFLGFLPPFLPLFRIVTRISSLLSWRKRWIDMLLGTKLVSFFLGWKLRLAEAGVKAFQGFISLS